MSAPELVLVTLAAVGIVYLLLAISAVGRLAGRTVPRPDSLPAVTILKPLHGLEPGLWENLVSFVEQDYPAPVQVILGLQRPDDPALRLAHAVRDRYPERDIEVVLDGRLYGSNRKVSNLANMALKARHEVIVLADSDMRAEPGYLLGLASHLAQPGVGAVTCPYHGVSIDTPWSALTAIGIDTHFLPGVAMAAQLRMGNPCMGSTIAIRRETLDALGGFRAFANDLADDHELGVAVRQQDLRVAVTSFAVGHVCPERSLWDLMRQELRWVRTVRQAEPAGHLGSLVTHPLPFALAAAILAPGAITVGMVVLSVAARFGVCLAAERAFGLRPHSYWLLPVRDILSFGLFVASFLGRGVSWRGHSYHVARSGALLPKTARPGALLPKTRPDLS